MEMVYFLTTFKHISEGWVYKVENKFTTLDAALKSFYAVLGNNVDAQVVDSYAALLTDSMGNTVKVESWMKPTPAPEPNED